MRSGPCRAGRGAGAPTEGALAPPEPGKQARDLTPPFVNCQRDAMGGRVSLELGFWDASGVRHRFAAVWDEVVLWVSHGSKSGPHRKMRGAGRQIASS